MPTQEVGKDQRARNCLRGAFSGRYKPGAQATKRFAGHDNTVSTDPQYAMSANCPLERVHERVHESVQRVRRTPSHAGTVGMGKGIIPP
jgi:hypothetical protein